jgi:ATP synthase F1 delta subunit
MNEDKVIKICQGLINYLKKTSSLNLLPNVIKELKEKQKKLQDSVEVFSAVPLDAQEIKETKEALKRLFKKPLIIINRVNPHLLGGIKIKFHDKVIDNTILGRIKDLEGKIVQK